MLQSRRGFLIGAGGLLTAAFVTDARSFIRRNSRPLLASPAQVAETLHSYHNDNDDTYHLSLGPWTGKPPAAPTWREFFASEGIAHQTEADAERIWSQHLIGPEDYDQTMSRRYWSDLFDTKNSPSARAYYLLSKIDVGPDPKSGRGPLLEFHEGDAHPGDNSVWVNAKDQLSLSLLQARLIDLKLPIKIVEGE
jgi:hypothetical protein